MIVLASKSPRRKELMHRICGDFLIDVSDIDESLSLNLSPIEAVKDIAKRKGVEVSKRHKNDLVISADTIVVIDNLIIGKPVDKKDAKRILRLLSNRTHQVITAFCLFKEDYFYEEYVISKVTFNRLNDEMIDAYIETGSPMDKAGAYGYQDNHDFALVKSIEGSVDNVIGFPVKEIQNAIEKIKN